VRQGCQTQVDWGRKDKRFRRDRGGFDIPWRTFFRDTDHTDEEVSAGSLIPCSLSPVRTCYPKGTAVILCVHATASDQRYAGEKTLFADRNILFFSWRSSRCNVCPLFNFPALTAALAIGSDGQSALHSEQRHTLPCIGRNPDTPHCQ
jgi:hypothetical protein